MWPARGWYKRRLPYIGTPPMPAAPRTRIPRPHVTSPPLPPQKLRGSAFFVRPPLAPPSSGGPTITKNTGTSVTSLTLSVPGGTVAGDLLVAFIANTNVASITPPAGWTLYQSTPYATNTQQVLAYYHQAGSSEPASYTWNGSSGNWAGAMVRAAASSPPETGHATAGVSGSALPGTMTTLGANRLCLAAIALVNQTDTPSAPLISTGLQQVGVILGLDVCYFTQASAGSTGTLIASLSPAGAPWGATDLAVPPGAGTTPFSVLRPLVVRSDLRRRGQATFVRPPLLPRVNVAGGVIRPLVVRQDFRRRGLAYFVRPPLKPPVLTTRLVPPPRVTRSDFRRHGLAYFVRPPYKAVGPPRILRPIVARSDFSRRGLVYFTRKLARHIDVAGGVIRPFVFRPPIPVRLTRGSVFSTWNFHTGQSFVPPDNGPLPWTTDDGARPRQTMARRPWLAENPAPLQAWVDWPGAEQAMGWQDQVLTPPVRRPWRPAADTSGLPPRLPDLPGLTLLSWLVNQPDLIFPRRVFRAEPDAPPPSPLTTGLSALAWYAQEAFIWPRKAFRALPDDRFPGLPAGDAAAATGWQQDDMAMRWRRPTWRAFEVPGLPPLAFSLDLLAWEAALYQSHDRLRTRPAFRAAEMPPPLLVALPLDAAVWVAAMQPADGRIVTARRQFVVDTGDPAPLLWRATPLPLDQQFAATMVQPDLVRVRKPFRAGEGAAPILDRSLQTAQPFVPPPGGEALPYWHRRVWRPTGYEYAAPPWIAAGVVQVLGPYVVIAGQIYVAGAVEGLAQSAD